MRNILCVSFGTLIFASSCSSILVKKPLKPPEFDHHRLIKQFYRDKREGHYPLTVRRGINYQPTVTNNGYMLYTSNRDGAYDIWLRNLKNTVNLPLVSHDSHQHSPAITGLGDRLAFVSEDLDARGDIRLIIFSENFLFENGPKEIIEKSLKGSRSPNLWSSSVNLSEKLRAWASDEMPPGDCQGEALERDPVWTPDGVHLIFVSDRCTPGLPNLWMMELDGSSIQSLRPLTRLGGERPAISRDGKRIAYLSYRRGPSKGESTIKGEIFIMDPENGREIRTPLPRGGKGDSADAFIYKSPVLSPEGDRLYYVAIRDDSNGNGEIDERDAAAIYSVSLENATTGFRNKSGINTIKEARLIDDSSSIRGVLFSPFIGDSLLYTADKFNSINIYFMSSLGIIPREADIHEQYRFSAKYKSSSLKRYLLALDAVTLHYGDAPEYALYEGLILLDKWHRLRIAQDAKAEISRVYRELKEARSRNPLVKLLFETDREELSPRGGAIESIRKFISEFERKHKKYYTPRTARQVYAAALELLSETYLKQKRYRQSLKVVARLNKEYPDYTLRRRSLLLQARTQMALTQKPPGTLTLLLEELDNSLLLQKQNKATDRGTSSGPSRERLELMRERALFATYDFFYKNRSAKQALKLTGDALGSAQKIHPALRAILILVQANAYYDIKNYQQAITLARQSLQGIDKRLGLYVQAWRIIAFSLEGLGDYGPAYEAKLEYGGAYRADSGAKVNVEEYLDIIEETERYIELYLRTARALVKALNDQDEGKRNVLETVVIDQVVATQISLNVVDRDLIKQFCRKDSRAGNLLLLIGENEAKDYVKFCARTAAPLKEGRIALPSKEVRRGAFVFYSAAYSYTTILNIMFLHIKRVNLFEDLYKKRAVHYHRLKVDIAVEKNRQLLEWKRQNTNPFGGGNLQEITNLGDPFDSEIYRQLESGYTGRSSREAREFGDLSLLYGYAYTLIQKSVQREKFYDRIQKDGVDLPEDRLKDYKELVLRDLKTAEFNLRYIIYTDPTYSDAYLLLGWMYQYLDDRRQAPVKKIESILGGIVNYITGTRPARPTDGVFYFDTYSNYFPPRLYETNVELYRQSLNMLEGIRETDPGELAHIHLNLANTFFNLLNFNQAILHYNKVDEIARRVGVFKGYVQEALFYFNRGRSYLYSGRPGEAAKNFNRTYQIYDEYERKPLHQEHSSMSYSTLQARYGGGGNPTSQVKAFKRKRENLLKRINAVRYKMSLLSAMLGMAYWEAGLYNDAVVSYEDAEFRLYGNDVGADKNTAEEGDVARKLKANLGKVFDLAVKAGQDFLEDDDEKKKKTSKTIERANLRNFLALAYQDGQDYFYSDENSTRAGQFALEAGLKRNDWRFQAQSPLSQTLGCLLGYGEDFSVIGEGKNPFGFSTLRQYELSLGILLQNQILRGDVEAALKVLERRREVFSERDSDVSLGRQGILTTYNNAGFLYYQNGNYEKSIGEFKLASRQALENGFNESFLLNLSNRFYALFALLEGRELPREKAISSIVTGLGEIGSLKEQYRTLAREAFIKQQTGDDPDFEYIPEKHDALLERKIERELVNILALEGSLLYYHGIYLDTEADSPSKIDAARVKYQTSLERFSLAEEIMLREKMERPRLRVLLNRARVYEARGELYNARSELEFVVSRSFEYNLVREEWEARRALAMVHREIYRLRRFKGSREQGVENLKKALTLLRKRPLMDAGGLRRYEDFYDYAAAFFIELGDWNYALNILEQRWEHMLRLEFFKYPLSFGDAKLNKIYLRYRSYLKEQKKLDRVESDLRQKLAGTEDITRKQKKLEVNGEKLLKRMLKREPGFLPFVRFSPFARDPAPALHKGQALIRLFSYGDRVSGWLFTPGNRKFLTRKIKTDPDAATRLVFRELLGELQISDLFLVTDATTFDLPLEDILKEIRSDIPAPVFLTRLRDYNLAYGETESIKKDTPEILNRFNVSTFTDLKGYGAYLDHADIVRFQIAPWRGAFPVTRSGYFNSRLWLSTRRHSSTGIGTFDGRDGPREDYLRAGMIYEILRAGGAAAFLLKRDKQNKNAGKKADASFEESIRPGAGRTVHRATGVYRLFGDPGFQIEKFPGLMEKEHRYYMNQAQLFDKQGKLSLAIKFYRIANSYLLRHPRNRELGLISRIKSARARMIWSEGEEGEEEFESLIRDYSAKTKNRTTEERNAIYSIYWNYTHALFTLDKRKEALGQIQALSKILPGYGKRLKAEARWMSVYRDLRQFKATGAFRKNFRKTFNRVYGALLKSDDAPLVARELYRRGLYRDALKMTRSLERDPRFRKEVSGIKNLTILDTRIIGLPMKGGLDPTGDVDDVSRILRLSFQNDWKAYERSLEELALGENLSVDKFRKRLYRQWKNFRQGRSVNLTEIFNVTVGRGTAYPRIKRLERAVVFRLLLEGLKNDTELQASKNLLNLIRAELSRNERGKQGVNYERAAIMSLLAARRFLNADDLPNTVRFFELYGRYSLGALPDALDAFTEARTGLAVLKFMGKRASRRDRASEGRWKKLLNARNHAKVRELYENLPLNFNQASIKRFNSFLRRVRLGSGTSILAEEINIALGIMKLRALSEKKPTEALNFAFLRFRLRNYLTFLKSGVSRGRIPLYENVVEGISAKMPANQIFVALLDANFKAYRLRITRAGVTQDELNRSGRYLTGKMSLFLEKEREGEPARGLYEDLSRVYRSLFGIGETRVTYFWFESVHALAPIAPQRGDRIFQVLNPHALLRNKPFKIGLGFRGNFGVNLRGQKSSGANSFIRGDRLEWKRRIDRMETLSLGKTSRSPGPVHLANDLIPGEQGNFRVSGLRIPGLTRPWFLSGNFMVLHPSTELANLNCLMELLSEKVSAPGVFTLRRSLTLNHPYFVKFYYSRSSPLPGIDRRYIEALLRLRRSGGQGEVTLYGYRLVTSAFVTD